jgi:hypothetical protein
MKSSFFLSALSSALLAALAPAAAVAAAPPIYLVVDFKSPQAPAASKSTDRRVVMVRAFDDGDAGACARAQMRFPNSPGSLQVSHCVRELPAEFAPLLQDGGIAKAYALKFTAPGEPGASYRLMYDMSMKDPPQVCRNLADYQQRFGHLPANTRIQCWVPKP